MTGNKTKTMLNKAHSYNTDANILSGHKYKLFFDIVRPAAKIRAALFYLKSIQYINFFKLSILIRPNGVIFLSKIFGLASIISKLHTTHLTAALDINKNSQYCPQK